MFHAGSFRNYVCEVPRKLQQTWVLWNPGQVWSSESFVQLPHKVPQPGEEPGGCSARSMMNSAVPHPAEDNGVSGGGLVLSVSPGSKRKATEQEGFKLGRRCITVGINFKLSVLMTLEAFDCSIGCWISLLPQKMSILSCFVLYKYIISFYYILFYFVCFL